MDSFLEEPRSTPKPTPVIQSIETPTVPEVSLMFQNTRKDKTPPINFGKQMQSYNAWKLRTNSNNNEFDSFLLAASNKENNAPDKSFLTKKQVRFQSPIHKSVSAPTFPINKNIEHLLPPAKNASELQNTSKHLETPFFNNITSPSRVDSNQLFQPTSMDTLKRLETLGISDNRPTTPKSTQFMNSTNSPNAFERMYCSGIPTPNKELDLSFLEPQNNPCPRQEYYRRSISDSPSKKFLNYVDHYNTSTTTKFDQPFITPVLQNNDIQSVNNKERSQIVKPPVLQNDIQSVNNKERSEIVETTVTNNTDSTETENINMQEDKTKTIAVDTDSKKSADDSPTVNDLLQIIKLQNDQLQRLQNQVEMLVKISANSQKEKTQNAAENVKNVVTYRDQQVGTSTNEEILQHDLDNNGKKISVGMMTSFEVSFKPPLMKKKNKTKLRNLTPVFSNDYTTSDCTSSAEAVAYQNQHQQQQRHDEEQNLQRNPRNTQRNERNYPNQWPTNNHRRNNETEYSLGSGQSLEIQEQSESPENSIHIDMQDYDTESEDSDDECSTDGWTFYKDILGQVNNILENSNRPAYRANKLPNKRNAAPPETETTLEQIQQNTLKRLQNDGFLQQNEQCAIRPNEISFAVKQILMKYLPDDGLAEAVATKNKTEERYNNDKRKPTDISVTAVKYMQQCNVVTNAPYYGRKQKVPKNKTVHPTGDPKILDITTLKQQPKLL